jgi:formylglycine-generating enzyme required for sulfatase activity
MRNVILITMVVLAGRFAFADTFGTGANQFTIDFVDIAADVGYGGQSISYDFTTSNIGYDYRIGIYEITNDQWNKFQAEYGIVTGDPSSAYDRDPYWTGDNLPTNCVSWYEAAQFVNWLNTSSGYQAAYNFTGTQGTADNALATWSELEAWEGENLYRHRDAYYFLPTEDEWVRAAYWNGSSIQTYATKPGESLHQGDGKSGTGWNYYDDGWATSPYGPWDVGSGSEELNGTYDMMGNVWELMENPFSDENYGTDSTRGLRGGYYTADDYILASYTRTNLDADSEGITVGFRVASVPEPSSLVLISAAGLILRKRRR